MKDQHRLLQLDQNAGEDQTGSKPQAPAAVYQACLLKVAAPISMLRIGKLTCLAGLTARRSRSPAEEQPEAAECHPRKLERHSPESAPGPDGQPQLLLETPRLIYCVIDLFQLHDSCCRQEETSIFSTKKNEPKRKDGGTVRLFLPHRAHTLNATLRILICGRTQWFCPWKQRCTVFSQETGCSLEGPGQTGMTRLIQFALAVVIASHLQI